MKTISRKNDRNHRDHNPYRMIPFPWVRVPIVDSLRIGRRKPLMMALAEVDVTVARQSLLAHQHRTGESLSFTAYIISCVAKAVGEYTMLQAYQQGRKRLLLFDDVDVCAPIEHGTGDERQATPYVIRAANRKPFRDIHREIRAEKAADIGGVWGMRFRRLYPHLPRALRRLFWWAFSRYPRLKQRIGGTVQVTAVGMFGTGTVWGISPVSDYTLMVVLGSIAEKPGVVDGRIEVRQYLCLTVSADHNVVDGAPFARFIQRLKELIESGYGLAAAGVEMADSVIA
jgi:pyruvate/2-oxoglutarate dehydrogenase complex dihydrolipoamide acyltransferase (E2) component